MAQSSDTSNGGEEDADFPNLTNLDPFEVVQTPHLRQVLELNQKFKDMFREFNQFVEANPINPNPTTPAEKEKEQHVEIEIQRKRKRIIAQLSLLKGAHRRAVMKTREEKEKTAKAKQENDGLVLQLHNLKYEQESLQKEIYAADNYDHKYTKLPLIPAEEFLAQFSEYEDKSESELMEARIDHEHRERVKLEEQRQEKLKIKQQLIAEVKRRKEDLGKLDESLEKFIDAALPIETALANE
jgi:THO complex subunit 5